MKNQLRALTEETKLYFIGLMLVGALGLGITLCLRPGAAAPSVSLPPLQGGAALEHLKQQGLYDSLAAAVQQTMAQPISPQAYLKASNTKAGDRFGSSVAVSGDTVVVGAFGDDGTATGVKGVQRDNKTSLSGAAYVFVHSGGKWNQQAYLKASNSEGLDLFGTAVAVSGDTIVVGAPYEASNARGINGNQRNNAASSSGAAYVFVRSGGKWNQQAYLKASNAGGMFGKSVAVSGNTIVVGAPEEGSSARGVNSAPPSNGAAGSGAAYVFVRRGSRWSQQAYLKASNTGVGSNFGISVAIAGDTVVVGSPSESSDARGVNGDQNNNDALSSGAAYVFVRKGRSWSQQAYLKAINTGERNSFGWSVAIAGDTVVVGAHGEDSDARGVNGNQRNEAPNSGAAYVFTRSGSRWRPQAYLKASNTEAGDTFGWSVAVAGDTIVVGSLNESSNARDINGDQNNNAAPASGAAYVFVRSGGTWSRQAYLKASNSEANDNFGYAVAVSGDMVIVGAHGESSAATGVNGDQTSNEAGGAGATYVFVWASGMSKPALPPPR